MRRVACILSVLLLAWASTARADWPGFRGVGHQGHSAEKALPLRWGATENVVWKVKLPGPGSSSPIVQGERVFVTCFTGKKAGELVRHLFCLERGTGKVLWEVKEAAPQPENDYTKHLLQHGFATATPICDDAHVYVNFCRGGIFAFDHAGKKVWRRELGKYLNSFGSGASLSLYGDLLLVNACVEAGALFALNKTTGETVWRAKIPGDCWATPVLATTAGGETEIVLNAAEGIYGFDPKTGKELWYCETVGGYVSCTPVVQKDVIYVTGTNFDKKMALALKAGGRGDVTKTHVLWRNEKVGASYCSPLLVGEHLYFFSGQGYCLKIANGEVAAQKSLDGVGQLYGSPVLAGEKIYLFTRGDGGLVLSADPQLNILARNEPLDGSAVNASPAVSHGRLFVRSNTHVYCLGVKGE